MDIVTCPGLLSFGPDGIFDEENSSPLREAGYIPATAASPRALVSYLRSVMFKSRSTPGEFADVEIPVAAISDADGFLFEFVNDLIQVDVLGENIHEQIS